MDKHGPPQPGFGPPPPGFVPPPPYTDGHQHPPQGPPPQIGPNVVFVQQPAFGPDTQPMTCPHCRASISTRVINETSTKTHLFALLLCLIGCWPCAPCPYCTDSCLTKKHYCPACNAFLGQYEN
ncbi:lipopolysaccharide-induced tumor necrosis factor-alpha factor homolog [Venturia canescens]|uniref:lipopolysaccharide-induced tumor necrosis factor-alpha factor homolog n=1 Tax=Venturia canescens TaxID=32260 RepID=UPI001C9BCC4F|nr:lipopolysaccharide-induced tumor necrosis factor-alpha factor homolog [Venturia canescens]XP_043285963.1 lipopolysaccharide-induced tumor necrosis factor-alpha factor homolog [Venturia canescens]